MAKINSVTFERTYNLGNYESCKVGYIMSLGDEDQDKEGVFHTANICMAILKKLADDHKIKSN